MTLSNPTDPRFGSRLSASEFRSRVTNPLYANDVALEDRIAIIEQLLTALPEEFYQATIPVAAQFKDTWVDASNSNQLYFCTEGYESGEVDKESKWALIGDTIARNQSTQAINAAGEATRLVIQDDPPEAFTRGWLWVDSSSSNRDMICTETYLDTDGPGGYGSLDEFRLAKFSALDSHIGGLLAAAEQGLRDGKTNTYVRDDVPESADGRDTWVDTNNENATYACFAAYTSADHMAYDSGETYAAGSIATSGGQMYQALAEVTDEAPPSASWSDLGAEYGSVQLFRESRWTPTADPISRAMALSAQGIADGKSENFYQSDYPSEADARDTYVNSTTKQSYICKQTYTGNPANVEDLWDPIVDKIAQDAIAASEALADGVINTYLQEAMPTAADIKDLWIDTDDNFKIYVCLASYTAGGSMANWRAVTDSTKTATYQTPGMPSSGNLGDVWLDSDDSNKQYVCIQAYSSNGDQETNWQATNDDKKTTFYLPDPPTAANQGDGWMDTNAVYGYNQFYVCNESYTNGEHGYSVEVGLGGSVVTPGKWSPGVDREAQVNAALALDVANGKTTTYYQDTLPTTAKRGDMWIDTDEYYPGTTIYRSYICILAYNPDGGNETNWEAYSDPVSTTIAEEARAVADGKRKIVYSANTPNATDYDGFDVGDGWVDTDENNAFKICKTAHSAGAVTSYWEATSNAVAEQALQIALDSQSLLDGQRNTFITTGSSDAYYPGPGSAAQWAVSNWPSSGARIGDMWLHTDTTAAETYIRYCNQDYTGFADGTIGGKSHWTAFTDAGLVADISSKLDVGGGTMSGPITFIAGQIFGGASLVMSGGGSFGSTVSVDGVPSAANHVIRKTELDAEATARTNADTTLQSNINLKMDIAGGTFTGSVGHIPAQVFSGASVAMTGGGSFGDNVSVTVPPSSDNHLTRKIDLDSFKTEVNGSVSDMNDLVQGHTLKLYVDFIAAGTEDGSSMANAMNWSQAITKCELDDPARIHLIINCDSEDSNFHLKHVAKDVSLENKEIFLDCGKYGLDNWLLFDNSISVSLIGCKLQVYGKQTSQGLLDPIPMKIDFGTAYTFSAIGCTFEGFFSFSGGDVFFEYCDIDIHSLTTYSLHIKDSEFSVSSVIIESASFIERSHGYIGYIQGSEANKNLDFNTGSAVDVGGSFRMDFTLTNNNRDLVRIGSDPEKLTPEEYHEIYGLFNSD